VIVTDFYVVGSTRLDVRLEYERRTKLHYFKPMAFFKNIYKRTNDSIMRVISQMRIKDLLMYYLCAPHEVAVLDIVFKLVVD
jgi:hypothetical protein